MKLQRNLIICSFIISIITFIVSLIFNKNNNEYLCNVFIGVFASSLLILFTSVISYVQEKKKRIYQLYCSCMEYALKMPLGMVFSTDCTPDKLRSIVREVLLIYYKEIEFCCDDLSILSKKSKVAKINVRIKNSVSKMQLALVELDQKTTDCMLQEESITEMNVNDLEITSSDTINALKEFQSAAQELLEYIRKHVVKE